MDCRALVSAPMALAAIAMLQNAPHRHVGCAWRDARHRTETDGVFLLLLLVLLQMAWGVAGRWIRHQCPDRGLLVQQVRGVVLCVEQHNLAESSTLVQITFHRVCVEQRAVRSTAVDGKEMLLIMYAACCCFLSLRVLCRRRQQCSRRCSRRPAPTTPASRAIQPAAPAGPAAGSQLSGTAAAVTAGAARRCAVSGRCSRPSRRRSR